MAYPLEKRLLLEFLEMYKSTPCLWNTSHDFYSNKVARNRGYDALLEKYKELDSMADRNRVKKKIENMRTTYKRERTRVLKSQFSGGAVYEPSLWYYNAMTFLDELEPEYVVGSIISSTENVNVKDDDNDNDDIVGDDNNDEGSESPPPRRPPIKRPKPMSVFVTENQYEETKIPNSKKAKRSIVYTTEDDDQHEESYVIKSESCDDPYTGPTTEPDYFGRTISAQLSELRPKQRFIAEKLISEVIFYGRLDKLKTGTSLNLNDNSI